MMGDWIQTDDYQWLRKDGDYYELYQIMKCPEYVEREFWYAGGGHLLLSDYESDILDNIQQFGYNDIDDVKRIYGDHWERIVAECVFECNWADYDIESFDTLDEALDFVNKLMNQED